MRIKELVIIVSISILSVFFSIYPTIYYYRHTPIDKVYTFLHNSVSDYPYYISFIHQGTDGRNTTIDQFTTEPQEEGFIHVFYLYLGKLGGLFTQSPIEIYFYSRIILGLILLLVSYVFISFYIPLLRWRLTAFLFFITANSFPHIVKTQNGFDIWQYLFWWTETDPFRRVTFIPHVLMGHIGLIGIIFCLIKFFETRKPLYFLISIFIGLLIGFTHPSSLGMIYYLFITYLLLITIKSILKKRFDIRRIFYFLIFISLTIYSLYYIYKTTSSVFPWTLMGYQESRFYAIDLLEYMLSIGPLFVLGVIGGIIYLIILLETLLSLRGAKRHGNLSMYSSTSNTDSHSRGISHSVRNDSKWILIPIIWVIIDIIMIPLSRILFFNPFFIRIPTFSNIRFLSMSIQLPLAILGVLSIQKAHKRYGKKVSICIIAIYGILTLVLYPGSYRSLFRDFVNAQEFIYPSRHLINAYSYLEKRSDSSEIVLANEKNSKLLPLFARNQLYFGQQTYTLHNDRKQQEVNTFFSKNMTVCDRYIFTQDKGIKYVIDENDIQFSKSQNQFLLPVYQKGNISLFEVKVNDEIEKECRE